MSMTVTSLNGAVASTDRYVRLASGTGAVIGDLIKVDSEFMQILAIKASPYFLVQRGVNGTTGLAHGTLATAIFGPTDDFGPTSPLSMRNLGFGPDRTYTYGTSGALLHKPGLHILKNPATDVSMTLTTPASHENGLRLVITSATAESVTLNLTHDVGIGGSITRDEIVFAAIGNTVTLQAVNGVWQSVAEELGVTVQEGVSPSSSESPSNSESPSVSPS